MDLSNVNKITRRIFSNSRIEIDFFMYLPSGEVRGKGSTLGVTLNPTLYIRYKHKDYVSEEYDYAKAAYKVTPRNLYNVIEFFNTIVTWLNHDDYADLFLVNNDGRLVFNADYKNLKVITHRGDYDNDIMSAIPTIVTIGDKDYEGANIYINKSSYCVPLTFQEIGIIFGIIKDFRFTDETILSLLSFDNIKETDNETNDRFLGNGLKNPFS